MKNLELWERVCRTDPAMTKPFDAGTYSGTQIDPQYQIKMATEIFGPFGQGWGVSDERFVTEGNTANETLLMFYHANLWLACRSSSVANSNSGHCREISMQPTL